VLVAVDARHVAFARPAAVAVHDQRHMARHGRIAGHFAGHVGGFESRKRHRRLRPPGSRLPCCAPGGRPRRWCGR
jgi:hypothetical protein